MTCLDMDGRYQSVADWWHKPDFIINELNVNSAITSPAHDELVPFAETTSVRGYAYAGKHSAKWEAVACQALDIQRIDLPSCPSPPGICRELVCLSR